VDLKKRPFRKSENMNYDDLAVAAAVFDNNGNLLTGQQKLLQLKLKDATLEQLNKQGLAADFTFDVQPGTYLVRIVVRDSEDGQMAAFHRGAQVP
jgi:uncharacterized protein (DUF2141 family)